MTNTVLSNSQLQYLAPNIGKQFRLYVAVFHPETITVQSQDVTVDDLGNYVNVPNDDLLAELRAPYAPQPNFGSNRIGFANEALFFDGSRSTQRGNIPAVNHVWSCTGGGTITTNTHPHTPGQPSQASITWAAPGEYSVSLTVTDRYGGVTTGTRHVMIYQDRDSAPKGFTQLTSLTGSLGNGGWTANITSSRAYLNIAPPSAMDPGTYQPIVILCETLYEIVPGQWVSYTIGQNGAAVPGQDYSDPRILFDGYIQNGTATQDSQQDTVSFDIATVDMVLHETRVHNIGYYNASYATYGATGWPDSQTPPKDYQGQLVTDFSTEDMYRSLLLDHTTVGQFHDIIIWRDTLPTNDGTDSNYYLTYSHLSANEGTIFDAISLAAQNEFALLWAERNGSICIGPDFRMRGYETLTSPTLTSPQSLGSNYILHLEPRTQQMSFSTIYYPAYVWGPNMVPQPLDWVGASPRDLSTLVGPPVAAQVSDTPIYDTATTPPASLWPSTTALWPQDITVRPLTIKVNENFTGRTTFVKLVGTLVNGQNTWASYYPVTDRSGNPLFTPAGLMVQRVAAGQWDVEDQFTLADLTSASHGQLVWNYLWEMARRRYYTLNALTSVEIQMEMAGWLMLHDLLLVTRQQAKDGPPLSQAPYYVDQITFSINLDQMQWTTTVNGNEVTSAKLGPMISPPSPVPSS